MSHRSTCELLDNVKYFNEDAEYNVFDPFILGPRLPGENDIMTGEQILDSLDEIKDKLGHGYKLPYVLPNGDIEDEDGMILASIYE